jgi:oligopeptide/dipeptide ABC transporter ATP-binding protein
METLLQIKNLVVNFYTYRGVVKALDGIDLTIHRRESLGLVGETGCGKSVTARSIIRLIDSPGRIERGKIELNGTDVLSLTEAELRTIRGRKVSFIFQEPKKALDPTATVGDQLTEAIQISQGISVKEAREQAVILLQKVGLADTHRLMKSYAFELSGGMAQRVMIAMAICGSPQLVIADEPTSALDVSVQSQILRLLDDLHKEYGSSLLLITHDLGMAAENCDQIAVMYAGCIAECGPVEAVFNHSAHPYTIRLLEALPSMERDTLESIPGMVPDLIYPPPGCRFSNRCDVRKDICTQHKPPMTELEKGHWVACYNVD